MLESWVSTNCTVPILEGTILISVVGPIYVLVTLWTTVKDDVVHAGHLGKKKEKIEVNISRKFCRHNRYASIACTAFHI